VRKGSESEGCELENLSEIGRLSEGKDEEREEVGVGSEDGGYAL